MIDDPAALIFAALIVLSFIAIVVGEIREAS